MTNAPEWKIDLLRLRPGLVWSMAISSLRVRMSRALLTLLTIATSTAFLMHLLTAPMTGNDPAEIESWHLMLGLSLLVSAAGVLNAMLMSVTQRFREIGTLKCLGALDAFVLYSVLIEAAILGLGGAVAGVAAGLLITLLIGFAEYGRSLFEHLRLDGLPLKMMASFGVGMALTTLGALVPAWIASRMPPMEAMRGEK
jgi:hypothetical protein